MYYMFIMYVLPIFIALHASVWIFSIDFFSVSLILFPVCFICHSTNLLVLNFNNFSVTEVPLDSSFL